jgi:hypothetical protein
LTREACYDSQIDIVATPVAKRVAAKMGPYMADVAPAIQDELLQVMKAADEVRRRISRPIIICH